MMAGLFLPEYQMDYDTTVKAIRRLYAAIHGKSPEITLTYKGTEYGVSKPWLIRCDAREAQCETHEAAAYELYKLLMKELSDKISGLEKQAKDYQKILDAEMNKNN
jgi:1,4-alpha-glucan branching enzyme